MVDIQLEFANPRQNGVTVFGSFLDDLLYVFPVHLVGDGGAQNVQGLFHALTAFRLGLEFWVKLQNNLDYGGYPLTQILKLALTKMRYFKILKAISSNRKEQLFVKEWTCDILKIKFTFYCLPFFNLDP